MMGSRQVSNDDGLPVWRQVSCDDGLPVVWRQVSRDDGLSVHVIHPVPLGDWLVNHPDPLEPPPEHRPVTRRQLNGRTPPGVAAQVEFESTI